MVEGSRGNFFQYGENQRVAAGNFVIAEGWPGNFMVNKGGDKFSLFFFLYICWAIIVPRYIDYVSISRLNPFSFIFKTHICYKNKIPLASS